MACCGPINKRLLPVKAFYFCCLAAVGTLLPFISIYMKQLGLTASETAVIYGLMPFIGFFVRPVIGILADKFRQHKLCLILCCLFCGAFFALILAVPSKGKQTPSDNSNNKVNLTCMNDHLVMSQCTDQTLQCQLGQLENPVVNKSQCHLQCNNSQFSKQEIHSCIPPHHDLLTLQMLNAKHENESLHNRIPLNYVLKTMEDLVSDCNSSLDSMSSFSTTVLKSKKLENQGLAIDSCLCFSVEEFESGGTVSHGLSCSNDSEPFICNVVCDENTITACRAISEQSFVTLTFWLFLAINLLANVAFAPIFPLNDAITYDMLEGAYGKWGQQRMFGTLGFGIFAITSSFIMDHISRNQTQVDYSVSFYIFGALMFMCAIVTYTFRITENVSCNAMMSNLGQLLKRLDILVFLIVVFVFGMMTGVHEAFLFWYLIELGSQQITIGLALAVTCMAEFPALLFAGKVINKIGEVFCLYLALLGWSIRFFCYSVIPEAWYVLPIELLHGITFALMYAAASGYGSIVAPKGMSATIQGLIGGLHFGLGKGAGSLLGGLIYGSFSPIVMFRSCAVFCLSVLTLYWILQKFVIKKRGVEKEVNLNETAGEKMLDSATNKDASNGDTKIRNGDTKLGNGDSIEKRPLDPESNHV
ncbi:unnamed protein product [Owenia fusiformis]|uniref:Major facilitator superfamily associated domain-containing protein n=1 Tax=Owenia fusiformis TaxID=6347 RepID=A0A8S4NB92_OWEFU|nr:unnamed protein product [Owenia fusiformis]